MVLLRRRLHQLAELSGEERRTAALIREALEACSPDRLLTGLGGHGLAALFEGRSPGPRVLIRSDLDALPIDEGQRAGDEASETPGVSHKCGHDGHMAIATTVARALAEDRPARGSVVLLYQPAEETGLGARSVLDDPRFAALEPDMAFALHNVPGFPFGEVVTREGVFASTARSLHVHLKGRTSHAAEPDRGLSPARALSDILSAWPDVPQSTTSDGEPALVTVVHARLGEPALGTTPGEATVIATLRAQSPDVMARLSQACVRVAERTAREYGLGIRTEWSDEFPCTDNHPRAVAIVREASTAAGVGFSDLGSPFDWTEDFGYFTQMYPSAMFGLGAGADAAPLHHPDYRFPDELIAIGARVFRAVIDGALNGASESADDATADGV